MDESIGVAAMPGRSRLFQTRSPIYESLIDDDSSPRILHSSGIISSRRSYDIVFCMSFLPRGDEADFFEERMDFVKWYKIKVYADSPLEDESEVLGDDSEIVEILPLWEGLLPHGSSFSNLDHDIYCLGGEGRSDSMLTFVPSVYKLDTFRPDRLTHLVKMRCSRLRPQSLVLDGNVYILSGHKGYCDDSASTNPSFEVEVYNPRDGGWVVLPEPPLPLGRHFICAALENPSRILIAPRTVVGGPFLDSRAKFCVYDVRHGHWKLLKNPERNLPSKCPLGDRGKALTVGNTLYWITEDYMLLAYLLDHDMWLLGHLTCLGLPIFGHNEWFPILLHLQDQRFCMVQSVPGNVVHCVLLDVYHKPMQKRLEISVASVKKYKTKKISSIRHCLLMGESLF